MHPFFLHHLKASSLIIVAVFSSSPWQNHSGEAESAQTGSVFQKVCFVFLMLLYVATAPHSFVFALNSACTWKYRSWVILWALDESYLAHSGKVITQLWKRWRVHATVSGSLFFEIWNEKLKNLDFLLRWLFVKENESFKKTSSGLSNAVLRAVSQQRTPIWLINLGPTFSKLKIFLASGANRKLA